MVQSNLAATLRELSLQTMEAVKPSDVLVGTVRSISPLEIQLDQKATLPASFFKLTRAVLDHDVDIEVNHVTEKRSGGAGDSAYAPHDHDYKGRKKIRIYNGLLVGEEVLLIRCSGGQSFVVLDRVHDHRVSGQWL